MTSIAKLKDKARKHEQKENWQAAIEVYQKVLDQQDENENLDLDLGLYNRIGDLNLRIGQTDEAVSYYEKAADKYAESGFYNNAIALCNKALRHRPDRAALYLKLSRLCTEQGFQTDARRWILEYAERKVAAGEIEDALTGLEEFAELSEDPEIREMLAQQLASHGRDGEAIDQLRTAYAMRLRAGEPDEAAAVAEKAREIDPDADLEAEEPVALPEVEAEDEMPGFGSREEPEPEPEEPAEAPEEVEGAGVAGELETTVAEVEEPVETEEVEGLETGDEVAAEAEAEALEGLEPGAGVADEVEGEPAVEELEGLESTAGEAGVEEGAAEEVSGLEVSYGEQEPAVEEEPDAELVGGLETFDRDEGAVAGTEEKVAEADEAAEVPAEDMAEAVVAEGEVGEPTTGEAVEGSQDFESEEEAEPLPLLDTGYGEDVEEAVATEPAEAEAAKEEPAGEELEGEELEGEELAEEGVVEEEAAELEAGVEAGAELAVEEAEEEEIEPAEEVEAGELAGEEALAAGEEFAAETDLEPEPIEPEIAEPVEAEAPEEPVEVPEPEPVEAGAEPVEAEAEEAEPVEALEPEEIAAGEAELEVEGELGTEDELGVAAEEEVEEPVEAEELVEAEEPVEAEGPVEEPEVVEPIGVEEPVGMGEPVEAAETAEVPEAESEELELSFEQGEPLEAEPAEVPEHLDVEGAFDLDEIDLGFAEDADSGEGPVEDLDIDAVLERARSLVSRALTDQALRELNLLSGTEAGSEVFEDALAVVNEILRHNPNDMEALQRRVEYAERIGDRELQVDMHLDLAEALERTGSATKARAMYQRALELDPSNEVAQEALGALEDVAVEEEDAVDLNALVRDMAPEGLEAAAGKAGETDPDFAAMLDQFRAKVAENVAPEDADDHYDLGLAFKEMGLIDEAIAEFQTALTAGEERLKVYEELGQCFVQKGQYNVAVKVFERAVKVPHTEEDELLGVYYHLGQCYEELGQRDDARAAYEKVLSIDETFADVPDRVARL